MNSRFAVVEASLNRAEFRWKWLRLVHYTGVFGILVCGALWCLGGAVLGGWLTSRPLAVTLLSILCGMGIVGWVAMLIAVLVSSADRPWLAAAIERFDRRLLDRLNTLLFLEKRRRDVRTESFARRIARQTQMVVAERQAAFPFSAHRPTAWFLAFLLMAAVTAVLNDHYSPWRRLTVAQQAKHSPAESEKPLELTPPPSNNLEQNSAWGEVRITDPGADLRVTKVDVVTLQIEAAANQSLTNVGWFSMVNGTEEVPHELPPPTEQRYAVYQPTLYLDEFHLSDWDVMTYYARARTDKQDSFASEVYFLEVRPFREDILKMPGGEGGQAYQTLNDLTALINAQRHVIRQTHQHTQHPPESEAMQTQDRNKLAAAEGDLRDSTQHLYARMATRMENKPIGDALDNLAKAEKSLGGASTSLSQKVMREAQTRERTALTELVAARKMFQKAVSEHPDDFKGDQDEEDQPPPVADKSSASKKLNEMAEFRNEARAAQEFVKKSLDEQRKLEQQAKSAANTSLPQLGRQEQQLQQALKEFQSQHPQTFKGSEDQAKQTQQAMAGAADSLQKKGREARTATGQATQEMEKLSNSMEQQAAGQQLADAYRLKQMLDQQIQTLDQRAQPDTKISDEQTQKTAQNARQTIEQLTKTAEQDPTRSAFGQPLRDALSGDNKVDLNAKLNRLERPRKLEDAQDGASPQQRAADARDALAKVSQAFEASEPNALQAARKTDSLKPGEQDGFSQGMAELESLVKQSEEGHQLPARDQAKQGQEALANLQSGMRSQFGDNSRAVQLLDKLRDVFKAETPVDIGDLKKLLQELQSFSVETSSQLPKKEDNPEVTNIDPDRLPPAYRGRIQKYLQKLSEK